jgi:hypothetical protein
MTALKRPVVLTAAVLALILVAGLIVFLTKGLASEQTGPAPAAPPAASTPPEPQASAPPAAPAGDCPAATITVSTATELDNALDDPEPGTVIHLADGVYIGNFTATGDGSADQPITVCGTDKSILDGADVEDGYVLHLEQASYWVLDGFAVRNGQKGVMVDETTNSILRNLTVSHIGDEAIHLRSFSTDNKVIGNSITDTGLRKPKFGEGIYIGTAESNWCDISNCEPDRSDRNEIADNTISGTTSESVDIKEGTSDGVLRNNTFDGSAIEAADSWVDVKGRGWTIAENSGTNSPEDGFQTHEIVDGWGTENVFRNNTAEVNGPGFGYALTPVRDNVVECNNEASEAESGLSNEPCSTS